ncbi:MAG: zinc ribbon domain-containing protein [Acidobacteriota bacterium]
MPSWCPRCGRNVENDEKFCRQCGMPQDLTGSEATTWMLSNQPAPRPEQSRPTHPVAPNPTGATNPPPSSGYVPPAPYYPPPPPVLYQPPQPVEAHISLGDWLSGGWQVYKENWALMSVASLLTGVIGAGTGGLLAGPMLMGLFRMAFATMRGERPVMGDLFNWRGRFVQAFLSGLIFVAVPYWLFLGNNSFLLLLLLVATPFLLVMFAFSTSLTLERGMDIAHAINQVGKLVFSRDKFMWWVVGLVFAAIAAGGFMGCIVGLLVTIPWMISAAAVAYRDVFGFDDPNRTLH